MAAGNQKGRPGGCPRRVPLVLFDLGVIHGRWCFAALEMCLGVFLGERRVGRQDDVNRAFLIERATVEPDGLGRLRPAEHSAPVRRILATEMRASRFKSHVGSRRARRAFKVIAPSSVALEGVGSLLNGRGSRYSG